MAPLSLLLLRLGRVVSVLRSQAGYSQDRFASAVGLHRTYMGLLERGQANPTMKSLDLVARGLRMNVVDLLTLAMAEDVAGPSGPPTDPQPGPRGAASTPVGHLPDRRRR